jgi:hypothetical protein
LKALSLNWIINPAAAEWDHHLSILDGHPLQSALWGDARKSIDGRDDLRFALFQGGSPVFMARAEMRPLPGIGKVAWIPRGPTIAAGYEATPIMGEFRNLLRKQGVVLYIADEYTQSTSVVSSVRTIWINLEQGLSELETKMDKQWRYGVRKALREGVKVEQSNSPDDVANFFEMCLGISQSKGFELPGSRALMEMLLKNANAPNQDMRLFLARFNGEIGAGAFVARSGRHAHYMWGAADRNLSRQRVGEAVQWAVINWAIENDCARYDLEGIDPVNNPGVYAFKKKMGGDEVLLSGLASYPLGLRGHFLKLAGRVTGRL